MNIYVDPDQLVLVRMSSYNNGPSSSYNNYQQNEPDLGSYIPTERFQQIQSSWNMEKENAKKRILKKIAQSSNNNTNRNTRTNGSGAGYDGGKLIYI